ncbi:hypothetical protein [Arthrobacter sp. Z1-15]
MLQISTGMYFDDEETFETRHRRVFYTNLTRIHADDVNLPVGTLQFASASDAVMISAVDRLPKKNPDGSDAWHIATDGEALLSDVADVVAFALDGILLDNHDVAQRLLRFHEDSSAHPRHRLRRTLTPRRFVTDVEVEDLRELFTALLALRRPYFEKAMRAIRRIVDASVLVHTDVTLAYSLYVAALESLSADTDVPAPSWNDYDKARRGIVDAAIRGLPEKRAEQIKVAVLEIDQLSLRRKFQAFVLEHIGLSYYRGEADEVIRPIQAVHLPRALDFAYRTRSVSLHEMRELEPELWAASGVSDTTEIDGQHVLTAEGLNRLSRHVIRSFIQRGATGVDLDFNWKRALPGQVQMKLDATMWLHSYNGFAASKGPKLFGVTLEMMCVALGGSGKVADMSVPLARIEKLLAGEVRRTSRVPLLATYVLWHRITPDSMHRPGAERIIDKYIGDLDQPSIPTLTLGILLGRQHPWTTEELADLIEVHTADLGRRRVTFELLPAMDAALQLTLAQAWWVKGDLAKATDCIAAAVELDPGNKDLIALETSVQSGCFPVIELSAYVTTGSLYPTEQPDGTD